MSHVQRVNTRVWCGKRLPTKGFVYVIILLFLLGMTMLIGVMLDRSLTGLKASWTSAAKAEAFQSAEAGVNEVMAKIEHGSSHEVHCNLMNEGVVTDTSTYHVLIECLPEQVRVLHAWGRVMRPGAMPVTETIEVTFRLWLAPPGKPVILEQVAWRVP